MSEKLRFFSALEVPNYYEILRQGRICNNISSYYAVSKILDVPQEQKQICRAVTGRAVRGKKNNKGKIMMN